MKTPNLNPDVMSHWIRCDTTTWCKIEETRQNVMTKNEITKLSVVWVTVRTSTIQQAYCTRVNHIWTDVTTQALS